MRLCLALLLTTLGCRESERIERPLTGPIPTRSVASGWSEDLSADVDCAGAECCAVAHLEPYATGWEAEERLADLFPAEGLAVDEQHDDELVLVTFNHACTGPGHRFVFGDGHSDDGDTLQVDLALHHPPESPDRTPTRSWAVATVLAGTFTTVVPELTERFD